MSPPCFLNVCEMSWNLVLFAEDNTVQKCAHNKSASVVQCADPPEKPQNETESRYG